MTGSQPNATASLLAKIDLPAWENPSTHTHVDPESRTAWAMVSAESFRISRTRALCSIVASFMVTASGAHTSDSSISIIWSCRTPDLLAPKGDDHALKAALCMWRYRNLHIHGASMRPSSRRGSVLVVSN